MPEQTDAGTQQTTEPVGAAPDGGSKVEQGTPAAAPDPREAELNQLKEDNRRLAELADRSSKDAAGAQAYVKTIMEQMQHAAARVDQIRNAPTQEQIRQAFDEDPQGVLDRHFQERMAPIVHTHLENTAEIVKSHFVDRVKEDPDWKAYKGEVEEFMKNIEPAVKAQPGAWDRAFAFVRSNHLDEIADRRAERILAQKQESFTEGKGISGAPGAKKVTLSEEQKLIAKGLRLSEEEYIQHMENPSE